MTSDSPSWKRLARLAARSIETPLRDWSTPADRFEQFSHESPGLMLDLSKQRMDDEILTSLLDLARDRGIEASIDGLFEGATVNRTEGRAALHTLLRAPEDSSPLSQEVHTTRRRMAALADAIRSGRRRGASGKAIRHVVHIGIGGSHLGPELAHNAMADNRRGLDVRFVANVDPGELAGALHGLNAEGVLFLVVSKSFNTLETLTNADAARRWLLERGVDPSTIGRHFIAISNNMAACGAFGLASDDVFPLWDWVGGRYSLWSAVGLPVALGVGYTTFSELLAGAHAMDEHFRTAAIQHKLPLLLALTGIWNSNFLGINNLAILPYHHKLAMLPAYLQQLEMESNGKRVDLDGAVLDIHTAPIIWGGVGTNGQHAFHQLLHQGTRAYAADFIVAARAGNDRQYDWLLANALAQSQAMMTGSEHEDPHRQVPGDHPSSSIVLDRLDAFCLGALLSLYEHKVFCQGIIWNINSFDQFGVELGKRLALPIHRQLDGQSTIGQDASTRGLIARLRKGVSDV